MRKIRVIPTIEKAFSCVFHHPKVFVPFLVLCLLAALFFVYIFGRFSTLFGMSVSPEEAPFAVIQGIFSLFALIFLAVILLVLIVPFFEGWTFAAAALAYTNEPVSLMKAAKKALSKYIGLLVITFVMIVAWVIIGSILSAIISVVMFAAMASLGSVSPESYPSVPSAAYFNVFFMMYGIIFLIMAIFLVFFVYMKPAYIVGEKRLSESLGDGFNTSKANFFPTFLIVLFFLVVPLVFLIVVGSVILLSSTGFKQFLISGPQAMYPDLGVLLLVGLPLCVICILFYAVFYAGLAYAYMDSHEIVTAV